MSKNKRPGRNRIKDLELLEYQTSKHYKLRTRQINYEGGWYCYCCPLPWKKRFYRGWKKYRKTQYR